jgi:hypothetical protein
VFVRDLFPALGDFQGTMSIEGGIDRPQEGALMAVTGIERRSGQLAMFPSIGVAPAAPRRSLGFLTVPSGGQVDASIVLVNPSTAGERARGRLAFFDEAGRPWSVSLNGQPAATSVAFDIGPRGSVVYRLPAGGTLQTGSARATATEGTLGGLLRVQAPEAGLLRLAPSTGHAGLVAPVRRDRAAGITTEIALASTGSEVDLRLSLRDAAGTEVAGGAATLTLAPNARVTRTLDQLFPGAATDAVQGAILVTAGGAEVAGAVIESSSDARRLIPMPVLPSR